MDLEKTVDEVKREITNYLYIHRKNHKLTAVQLSDILGISPTTLTLWEKGERFPKYRDLVSYFNWLQIDLKKLPKDNKNQLKHLLGKELRIKRLIETDHSATFVANQLGVSKQVISYWERGTHKPSEEDLGKLEVIYDLKSGYFSDFLRTKELERLCQLSEVLKINPIDKQQNNLTGDYPKRTNFIYMRKKLAISSIGYDGSGLEVEILSVDKYLEQETPHGECVILPDGRIISAIPSHNDVLESLLNYAYGSKWLVSVEFYEEELLYYTGSIMCWEDVQKGFKKATQKQRETLEKLSEAGVIENNYKHYSLSRQERFKRLKPLIHSMAIKYYEKQENN